MGTAQATVQEMIEATQVAATITYGQRAIKEMRGAKGCTVEYGGAGWAIAQYEAAATVAEIIVGAEVSTGNAEWMLKRAAKIVKDRAAEARAGKQAIGTQRQMRIALAA